MDKILLEPIPLPNINLDDLADDCSSSSNFMSNIFIEEKLGMCLHKSKSNYGTLKEDSTDIDEDINESNIYLNLVNFLNQIYEETVLGQKNNIIDQRNKFKKHLLKESRFTRKELKVKNSFIKLPKQLNHGIKFCCYENQLIKILNKT